MQLSDNKLKWQCSLIIPVYNESENILKCLKLISDTYSKGVEVIIINDGSTDDTESLALEFIRENKIDNVFYFKQENKGAASARLYGIENSSTDYIAMLKFSDNTEIDFVLFDYYSMSKNNSYDRFVYSIKNWPITGLEAFSNTIEYWGIHAFGIYRKSTILAGYKLCSEIKIGSEDSNNVNDDELIARCAMLNSRLVALSDGKYLYSANDNSTTRRLNKNLFKMAYTTMSLRELISNRDDLRFLEPPLNLYMLRVSTNLAIKNFKWKKQLSNNRQWITAISMLVSHIQIKDLWVFLAKRPVLLTWSMIKYICLWIVYGGR
jgi:glycosyltransferase involved in cell wall biosynthesis